MSDPIARLNRALEGRYSVEREIGEGGMATVYLAKDLRHNRSVALKVLKPELAAVVGAERFLAEIETTANLQHPHILPLFDSGEADGFLFYVMPYVEGESLRERLEREKQLPVDEAVRIATDVAEALHAAHEQGVIHRDVKPANILLSKGRPLVADFGIALAVSAAGGGRLTETGLSMGTPYYMSPEQASADREPTAASDLYSLGCVLYEMLAGEPPYTGGSAQAVLAKILMDDAPAPTTARPSVPANVDSTIRRSLEKLPADRFSDAREFARALGDPAFRHGEIAVAGVAGAAGPWNRLTIGMTIAAAVFAAVALGAVTWATRSSGEPPARAVGAILELPANAYISFPNVGISPDGSAVVVDARVDGRQMLMVQWLDRPLERLGFSPIAGTEGGDQPILSPDGRSLAFTNSSGLQRVSLEGGPLRELDTEVGFGGGDWAEDGTIYYARSYASGLWAVSADGGTPVEITRPDRTSRELGHWYPQLLPDGEHLLFTAYRTPIDSTRIMAVSLRTGDLTLLQDGATHARYAPSGHLLFARGSVLYAVPFDVNELQTTGGAQPLVDGVAISPGDGLAAYSFSDDGTLVYLSAEEMDVRSQIVSVDRATGDETTLPLEPGRYRGASLSPDGQSLAMSVLPPGEAEDVFIVDIATGRSVPLAQSPAGEFAPIWAPAGDRVFFICEVLAYDICSRAPNTIQEASLLLSTDFDKVPYSFSADGTRLIVSEHEPGSDRFLSLPLEGPDGRPDTLSVQGTGLATPAVSPDGAWIAYGSDETGRREVWIESLDATNPSRYPVSTGGGRSPLWTKGGSELVYRDGLVVYSVALDPGSGRPGAPQPLLEGQYGFRNNPIYRQYDVTPGGDRFIMIKPPDDELPRRLTVVTHFFEELRRLVPAG